MDRDLAQTRIFNDVHAVGEGNKRELAFGFEPLTQTLAQLAWNPRNDTPFTVVVRGDWGRGKTTLLRAVQARVERTDGAAVPEGARRIRTLWFNAWKYPSEDTVLAGLLGQMLDSFRQGDMDEQFALWVGKHKSGIGGRLIKSVAPWIEMPEGDASFSEAERKRAWYDQFRTLFTELMVIGHNRWKSGRDNRGRDVETELADRSAGKVYAIFIDDLDRCRPERIEQTLEAINLFLDMPGVCFFLGLDWQRVRAALQQSKHIGERAEEYLEKIVQIQVDLPAISRDGVREYLTSWLEGEELLAHAVPEADRKVSLNLIADVLQTDARPRRAKRFLNDLSLTLAQLRNANLLVDAEGAESGEAPDEGALPAQAVLHWHALRARAPDWWNEIRARRQNLDDLIRRLQAEKAEQTEADDEAHPERARLATIDDLGGGGLLAPIIALDDAQRHQLINFGSPRIERTGGAANRRASFLTSGGTSEPVSDLALGDPSAWVQLPAAEFTMGSNSGRDNEKPQHRRAVSAFRIARFPVTNEQYAAYVESTGSGAPRHWEAGRIPEGLLQHPVTHVSWTEAVDFCRWLQAQPGIARGGAGEIRLPSEGEWEYAARGTDARAYPWGAEEPDSERANFGDDDRGTTTVNAYPRGRTRDGVWDLAGNVWEWCGDWHAEYPNEPPLDHAGPDSGSARALRGGAFNDHPDDLRAACRGYHHPEGRNGLVGFRVVWRVAGGRADLGT